MFMGRVAEEKNIDFLIDILRELIPKVPHLKFLIAERQGTAGKESPGPEANKSNSPCLPGYLTGQEMARFYATVDLFVFGLGGRS